LGHRSAILQTSGTERTIDRMDTRLAESEAEFEKAAEVLLQLRDTYDKETLLRQIKKQQRHGYQIAYVESDGEVLCVAGFVVGVKLAWGKHIYVDDLVTAKSHRSAGAGAPMIAWLKAYGRKMGCKELHLDSGVQRFRAHRFYLREGFNIASHHFSTANLSDGAQ
jgi:GNAT superfamily N-acetyltransferase